MLCQGLLNTLQSVLRGRHRGCLCLCVVRALMHARFLRCRYSPSQTCLVVPGSCMGPAMTGRIFQVSFSFSFSLLWLGRVQQRRLRCGKIQRSTVLQKSPRIPSSWHQKSADLKIAPNFTLATKGLFFLHSTASMQTWRCRWRLPVGRLCLDEQAQSCRCWGSEPSLIGVRSSAFLPAAYWRWKSRN